MKPALTAQEIRDLEGTAVRNGVSIARLMENAGTALAEAAMRLLAPDGQFLILCGQGNNGGDGLVAARKLASSKRRERVELVGRPQALKGAPEENYRALLDTGIEPTPIPRDLKVGKGDVVIDALLGTGLNRAPSGAYAEAIERIASWKAAGAAVLAADIPSGLDADTGRPYHPCVKADLTVSFGYLKLGQVLEPGASICGLLEQADIGLPAVESRGSGPERVFLLEETDVQSWIPPRAADSHKGTYGHVLVVAGSPGKSGAAALCGIAALRSGAGLVTVACRENILPFVLAHAPELMGHLLPTGSAVGTADLDSLVQAALGKSAVVIGPGIARGSETHQVLRELLFRVSIPMVIDADGLNALAGHTDILEKIHGPIILTPHPGEMARLLGTSASEVQKDRVQTARSAASRWNATVVLKGARTVVASPGESTLVCPTGNPGMATGGTGDVLSGMCASLVGQGLAPHQACAAAVYAHGLAGDRVASRRGQMGLIASDLFSELGHVWARWGR